ncbi:MAG: tetratricopeptide repeat protein, partial [Legionellales bacterium]|nr:tetratricopeptide repeat protein [Legionellales bacterium]
MKSLMPWFCLVATVGAHAAIGEEGVDAYRQGHYFQAAETLHQSTNKDPVIDYYMARMRLYGYGQLKNNVEAMKYFRLAGEKGFLPAIYVMGLYSLMVENQPEPAFVWFKKAADQNDIRAQMYCAAAYLYGVGVKKNTELAKKYYIPAARSGDAIAQCTLAEDFLDSRQAGNKKLGLIWLNKSVAQNNPEAQVRLGVMYANGTLVDKDLVKAKEMIELAVAQRYVPAWYQMGVLAQKNNDFNAAKDWYNKAAMVNYGPAEMALAQLYLQPKSPLFDEHLGFLWMLKSAQNGFSDAQLALSTMYQHGQGVEADANVAAEWQKRSTTEMKDDPQMAQIKAARFLSHGKSDSLAASGYHLKGIFNDWQNAEALKVNNYNQAPQMEVVSRDALFKPNFVMMSPNDIAMSDYYDAFVSLQRTASKPEEIVFPRYPLDRSPEIQPNEVASSASQVPQIGSHDVAEHHDSSSPLSDQALFTYLQGRSVLGDPMAQFTLGQMYEAGIAVTKNVQEAIKVYQLASAQQELRSEYNLGMLYLEGKDVPRDLEKAMTLLRDAAFKGNDHAQYALASIDELGVRDATGALVVQPSPEQALVMYDLAAANDYGLAKYRLAELLVRENKTDLSVQAKQQRHQMVKTLYEGAYKAGVDEAALPLAYYQAMSKDPSKQAQAFLVARKEAHTGNPGAVLLLGLLYDRGIGTEVNPSEAIQWYQKAASNPVTAFILGTDYGQGTGISKDVIKGKTLLKEAADGGFSYAFLNLAVMRQQTGEAFLPELEKALALGNSKAGLLMADYYLSLADDAAHLNQSRDIYQHLAEKGDEDAQLKLGIMFEK